MNDHKTRVAIYDNNPFIDPVLYRTDERETFAGNVSIKAPDGERQGPMLMDSRMVDKEQFFKLYNNALIMLTEVGRAALQLFNSMIDSLALNQDSLYFDLDTYAESIGKSRSHVYRLIRELIDKKFIAKSTTRDVYFININLVCKGNRLTIIQQYVKKNGSINASDLRSAPSDQSKPIQSW